MTKQEFSKLAVGDRVHVKVRTAKVVNVNSFPGQLVEVEYTDTKRRVWKRPRQIRI